jgi:ribosomal protein S18 acetylase RimI-like enzyme
MFYQDISPVEECNGGKCVRTYSVGTLDWISLNQPFPLPQKFWYTCCWYHWYIFAPMYTFSNPNIAVATIADILALNRLLNSAYRGETSKQGWTTEADLIAGETRTDEADLKQLIEHEGSVLLKYTNEQQQITGCVNLQQHGDKLYLGMLSVDPQLQGGGIGKQLLQAAEEYAKAVHCTAVYMSVITARIELIQWYGRHGYKDTSERHPFVGDELIGHQLQPLEFMMMEKKIE